MNEADILRTGILNAIEALHALYPDSAHIIRALRKTLADASKVEHLPADDSEGGVE